MNKQTPNVQSKRNLPPPDVQLSKPKSTRLLKFIGKFAIGFLSWYLVVGLIYWSQLNEKPDPQGYGAMVLSLGVFPIQILALAILFLVKAFRDVGWGMLAAIWANLVISLILGLIFNALCFIPFFAP